MNHLERRLRTLAEPVDAASLAVFRMLFGALVAASAVRFLLKGGVARCFVEPITFFHYTGFEWVVPLSATVMTGLYVAQALFGVCIAVGLLHRFASIAFFAVFTYAHLADVSNYLNHYHLVSLLALLLAVVPANRYASLDAKLGIARASDVVPRWSVALLRFQVGLVYVFAAVAKAQPDWLLHGQPLQIWMGSQQGLPIVGPLLGRHDVALALSWAGFLNDALAVPLLLAPRTRRFAFAMIVTFHAVTNQFFNIGIFPWLMPIGATLFFEPSYPRRLLPKLFGSLRAVSPEPKAPSRAFAFALACFVAIQVLVPLRCFAYGGDVIWHEQGMRFSWRVMVRKKSGSITYRVRIPGRVRDVEVHPRRYLNDFQEREFAGQPDLVLQLAHRIAADVGRTVGHPVEVRADAWVSLNGRPPARMIDPEIDLAKVTDGFAFARYILPTPPGPPAVFPDREPLSQAVERAFVDWLDASRRTALDQN